MSRKLIATSLAAERSLLKLLKALTAAYITLGVACLVIGALTNHSPWWLAPIILAAGSAAAETWQERRVRELERRRRR